MRVEKQTSNIGKVLGQDVVENKVLVAIYYKQGMAMRETRKIRRTHGGYLFKQNYLVVVTSRRS
jgi:hypothetical protein